MARRSDPIDIGAAVRRDRRSRRPRPDGVALLLIASEDGSLHIDAER